MPRDTNYIDGHDPITDDALMSRGIFPGYQASDLRSARGLPPTTAGLPALKVRNTPELKGTNVAGFIVNTADRTQNPGMSQVMFVSPDAANSTVAHETEHLLARQNSGSATAVTTKFNELIGNDKAKVLDFLASVGNSTDYLKDKYGIKNAYTTKDFTSSASGYKHLHEVLATLASAESALGVDLTKDPKLRKTIFKDKSVREAYNAVTGLRQTRLDPRDLQPYTPIPEKDAGAVDKLKQLIGFANGGFIPNAGRSRYI